ncbi:hypothetical protein D3C81_1859220 [compost metagenome]
MVYRFGPAAHFDEAPAPARLLRLLRSALHEVGHRWGIPHLDYSPQMFGEIIPQGAVVKGMTHDEAMVSQIPFLIAAYKPAAVGGVIFDDP